MSTLSPELEQRIRSLAVGAWSYSRTEELAAELRRLVEQAQAEALQSLAAKAETEDIRDWVLFHAQERKQP